MNVLSLLNGVRFLDSFFPSGGFAFSSGLEAAVRGGAVRDSPSYKLFVSELLRSGLGTRESVAVGLTWDAARENTFEKLLALDLELDAMQWSSESRKASRQMGRQISKVAAQQLELPLLKKFHGEVIAKRALGHLPIALGLTLYGVGWGKQESVAGFLYQTIVGYNAAAVKLLPIGQSESQELLHEWMPLVKDISAAACNATVMASWTPAQDIYAMRHSRLAWRLFRS